MHYLAFVVVPPEGDVETAIDQILEPWNEERYGGFWDWYQIGGRWTGHFDGYDPQTDPANQEVCIICSGSGRRDWSGTTCTPEWIAECNGCNGCNGTGTATKWSTSWADHDGDVVPVPVALAKAIEGEGPYTLVAGEAVIHRETYAWDSEARKGEFIKFDDFDKKVVEILTATDPTWRVAIVDYHC